MKRGIDVGRWLVRRSSANTVGIGAMVALALLLSGCTLDDLFGTEVGSDGDAESVAPTSTLEPDVPVERGLLQVGSIEVLILESFPVQVNVVVRGALPDGCTSIGEIVQARDGNAVTVTIATNRDPLALCTQAIVPVEETVSLEGDFPTGEYTVTVNGVTETFRV